MQTITVTAAKRLGIVYCHPSATLHEVVTTLVTEDISCLVVVDEKGLLEGVISRTDVVRAAIAKPDDWPTEICHDWMTRDVVTIAPDALLEEAAILLQEKHIHRVVVVESEGSRWRPIAVVSDSDVVYDMADQVLPRLLDASQ